MATTWTIAIDWDRYETGQLTENARDAQLALAANTLALFDQSIETITY